MTEKIGVLGKKTTQRTDVERIVVTPLPTVYGKFRRSAISTTNAATSKWPSCTATSAPKTCSPGSTRNA